MHRLPNSKYHNASMSTTSVYFSASDKDHTDHADDNTSPILSEDNDDEDHEPNPHYVPVPPPLSAACEEVTVRCLLEGKDPLVHYPKIEGTPFSEYDTPFLLTYLFPHLFPGGRGDPTDLCRARPVKLKDAIAHLIHV